MEEDSSDPFDYRPLRSQPKKTSRKRVTSSKASPLKTFKKRRKANEESETDKKDGHCSVCQMPLNLLLRLVVRTKSACKKGGEFNIFYA